MEWCSAVNPHKKFKKGEDVEISSVVRTKISLYFFIEYIWNDSDGECTNNAEDELISWVTSQAPNIRNSLLFADGLEEIIDDPQHFHRLDATHWAKLEESHLLEIQHLNNRMKNSQLALRLRKILPFFINRKDDDENYKNDSGQSILHIFLKGYLGANKYLTINQVSRLPKFVKNIVERREGLFYEIDSDGKTPLDVAANCKNKKVLEIIVANLADVKATDENGNSALHVVIENCIHEKTLKHKVGYLNIVRNLVARGADINKRNKNGLTAVHLAAMKFHVAILKYFANNGADFLMRTLRGENSLHLACKSSSVLKDQTKSLRTINFLVKSGCDLGDFDQKGFTPLHYAAEFRNVEVVERLLKLGAKVDCPTTNMLFTPLYLASKANRLDNMMAFVDAGADVNSEAADGSTPIFMSVLFGSYESMQYLVERGADLYKRDNLRGLTLLHYVTNDKVEATSEERQKKFQFLIEKKFDPNDSGYCGITPLQMATIAQNFNVVKILIERGANVNFLNNGPGLSALHLAAIVKDSGIAKILLDNGADVNCKSAKVMPLHMALLMDINLILEQWYNESVYICYETTSFIGNSLLKQRETFVTDHEQMALLLIENGAEINAKDNFGKAPLHLATIFECNSITKRLLTAGSHVNVPDFEGRLPLHNIVENSSVKDFELLLKFGADINDSDISEIIVNSGLKDIAIEHAIKLDLIGLPIGSKNEVHISSPEFTDFRKQCTEELEKLKSYCCYRSISFYKFLRMSSKNQYHLAGIVNNCDNIEELFPLYCNVIRAACCESTVRNLLLKTARSAWKLIFPIDLPDVCIEIILSHLKNKYLEVFTVKTEI